MKERIEFTHIPTEGISEIKDSHPFRIFCSLCRRPIAASETPLPKWLVKKFEGAPCSKCVSPIDYAKKLLRKK